VQNDNERMMMVMMMIDEDNDMSEFSHTRTVSVQV
jgi:hypothetical protein